MIDEENWDGDKDPIVRTKWFNKYGQRHVSRQAMFRMLKKGVSRKRTQEKRENAAYERKDESPSESQ